MVYKALRKAGLGGSVLKLAKPFIRTGGTLPGYAEAMETLTALSPDPGSSCLRSAGGMCADKFDLDIIIPAYNVENYIARCIDSALNQQCSYRFRLIIVDDGSTDSTGAIIDRYAQDERLTIIHQENRGFSGARNRGLACSDAAYIMFLDSDDSLPAGALQALLSCAFENGAALVEGAYNTTDTEGRMLSSIAHKSGCLDCRNDFFGFTGMKIISAGLMKELQFPEGYWYEDSIMAQIIYPLAERSGCKSYGISAPVYNYTINPKGISHSGRQSPKSIDSLWITMQLYKDREKLGLEKDQKYYEYILRMIVLSYRRAENQSEETKRAMLVLWQDFLGRNMGGFESNDKNLKILEQAVRAGNFRLYSAACRLI